MRKKIISLILVIAFLNFTIAPYLVETDIRISIPLGKIIVKTLDLLLFAKEANAETEPPCNNTNDENKPGTRIWNAVTSGGVNLSNGDFFRMTQDLNIPGRGLVLNITRTYNTQPIGIVPGWALEAGSWIIENGEYSGEGDRSASVGIWSDFTLEAKIKTITPGEHFDYETGWINFRYTNKQNRYYFLIHTNGDIELSKYLNGTRSNLARKSTSYNPLNWNTIKIITSSNNIKIYVNGTLEMDYTDATQPIGYGKIALESYFCHAHYDNISIASGQTTTTYDFNQTTDQEKSIFGYGWTFNYGMKLVEYSDGYVIVHRSDGGLDVYSPKAGGGYTPPTGVYDTLTKYSSGYTVTTKYGVKFNFDIYGKLSNVQDRNSNQIALTYDANSKLTTLTDPSDRQITFAYGANGKVSYITDPAGRHIYYDYDIDGNLIKVTDPKGNFIEYTYYPTHNIKTWSDKEGNAFTNTYYYNDRVATQTDPLGNITTINYSWDQTSVTNHKGEKFLYTFDSKDRFYWVEDTLNKIEGRAWDDKNNLLGIDDKNGRRTNFEYDQNGNQTKIIRRSSGSVKDLTTQITYEYTYNQPISQIDPLGNKTEFEYDQKGNLTKTKKYFNGAPLITQMTYDNYGNVLTIADPNNKITAFTYDAYGNKTSTTDPFGKTATFSYDIIGRLLSTTDPNGNTTTRECDVGDNVIKTTDALGHQIINTYNKNGAVISTTDPNGNTATYEYDALGNTIKTTDPLGNIATSEFDATNYLYDDQINQTKTTDPLGNTTTYQYDSLGRRLKTIDALGNETRYEYDSVGNLLKVTDALGNTIIFEYDYFYRKIKVTDPLGRSTNFTYDDVGNVLSTTDANGRTTTYEYDTLYRRTKVVDPQSNVTAYSYDILGNLTSVTDAYSNKNQITYDALSRKTSMDDPDMGYWKYEYDSVGNLIRQTDAKGQFLLFEYDRLYRLTAKKAIAQGQSTATTLVAYTYDVYEDPNIPNSKGKLTKITDLSGSTVFYYDKLGREIKTEKTIDGTTYTIERTYDKNSRLSSIKYPDNETINYTYNAVDSIKTVIGSSAYVSNVDYTPLGQMKTLTYGNNTKTEYDYYNDLRLKELKTTQIQTGQSIQRLFYNFDNVGNITTLTDYVNTGTQTFTYDVLDRLTSASGTYGRRSYQYDAIGNMLSKDGVSYFYGQNNSKPHVVTSGSDSFYALYDDNGNMIKKNQAVYEYDVENRLTKVKKETGDRVSVSIQLKPGWNLFSLPVIPDNPKISVVLSGLNFGTDYDELARFNAETQTFQYYFGDPQFNQFDTLSYGIGYEIYITNANPVTLTITGNLPPSNYNIPLKDGWNLIGSSVLNSTSMQTALSNLTSGVDYDKVSRYNTSTNAFEAASTMEKGGGYFIYCLKDATWNIQGATTQTQTQAQFIYDGDGGRVKVITPTRTTTYIGSLFEKDSTGKTAKHVYLGPNKICSVESTGNTYYIHPDHLGSSNITTSQTGLQVSLTEFTPYGSISKQTGAYDPKYKFTGKELDSTGLYFYGARYYDPELGRFISADTIIQEPYDPQSLNRYSYCRNNPINYIDPTGHKTLWGRIKHAVGKIWDTVKGPVIAAAVAVASAILMAIPGGQPFAVLAMQSTWIAAASAAATTATLDTGEGRKVIRHVGKEFFDDVLGMRPATAYTWANITTYMAVNWAYQTALANVVTGGNAVTAKDYKYDPRNRTALDAKVENIVNKGKGYNYGGVPTELKQVSRVLFDKSGDLVGVASKSSILMLGPQHTGIIMNDIPSLARSIRLRGIPGVDSYGIWGISHQAVNVSLLEAGYSSTVISVGGGWTTVLSTAVYGPYGGGAGGLALVASQEVDE